MKKAITEANREYEAQNLLKLCEWHKKTCNIEDCGISLLLMLPWFEHIAGRKATNEERKVFI